MRNTLLRSTLRNPSAFDSKRKSRLRCLVAAMCYAGKYRLEGNSEFTTTVTAAWHPSWIGTEQVRFFDVKGNALTITTAMQTHPNFPGRKGRGIVMWHKAK